MQEQSTPPTDTPTEKVPLEERGHLSRTQLYMVAAFLSIAVLGLVGYIAWTLLEPDNTSTSDTTTNETQITDTETTESEDDTDTSETETNELEATTTPTISTKSCDYTPFNLSLEVPSDWNCEYNNESDWVYVTSNLFSIDIADGGRGPYCGDGPTNPNDTCETEVFYSNELASYILYSVNGQSKEIWGVTDKRPQTAPIWIAIKYENMETQELSQDDRETLITVLDSIEIDL